MTNAIAFKPSHMEWLNPLPTQSHNVPLHVSHLVQNLGRARSQMDRSTWTRFCREHFPATGWQELIHKDPFTLHAFRKPRGYAGDAVLIDYIYKHPDRFADVAAADALGQRIFAFTGDSSACRSVRQRREMIASEIDRIAVRQPNAQILSFACGHLREGLLSTQLPQGRIGGWWAVDQDEQSLEVVRKSFEGYPIHARIGTVMDLIRHDLEVPASFDFAYSSGLLDYLDHKVAVRVTERLLRLVAPGGKLWIVNFLKDHVDAGYMEACMDWWLIYRDRDDMLRIADDLPQELVSSRRLFTEPEGNLVFVELIRR